MRRGWTVLVFIAALFAGCGDDGVRPRTRDSNPTAIRCMPLALGNTWTYHHEFTAVWTNPDGSDARTPVYLTAAGTREIVGTETIDGREYKLEYQRVDHEGRISEQWRRFRQDGEALYRADVALNIPPGEVDLGGEDLVEQLRLRFPLTVGDSWRLRPFNDFVVLTVDTLETLQLADEEVPAYRVRVDVATAGPDDSQYLWYGADGLLRREVHTEIEALDASTGLTIRIVTNEIEEMTGAELVE